MAPFEHDREDAREEERLLDEQPLSAGATAAAPTGDGAVEDGAVEDGAVDDAAAEDGPADHGPEDGPADGNGAAPATAEVPHGHEDRVTGDGGVDARGPVDAGAGEPPTEDPVGRAQRERDEYLALAKRTQADFENYRKRAAREAALAGQRAKAGLVRELLPAIDNLERALESADAGEDGLAKGVELVLAELIGVLDRSGVQAFEPVGEPFDPTVQEALATRKDQDAEPGRVLEVAQKGYRLGDTVIRPARVVVSA